MGVAVLFVCSGNICRSPTAEGVFRHLVRERGLADLVDVDSAGVGDWHAGKPPDRRSQRAALERGYDLSQQRARALRPSDCRDFDILVGMDDGHLMALEWLCRAASGGAGPTGARPLDPHPPGARLALMLDFAPELGVREVPDPYYGGADGFARVLDLIEAGARGLLAEVESRLAGGASG